MPIFVHLETKINVATLSVASMDLCANVNDGKFHETTILNEAKRSFLLH